MMLSWPRAFILFLFAQPVGATLAADMISVPTSGESAIPLHDEESDWNGFYAGIYGVGQSSPVNGGQLGLGALAGINAQFDLVLVGAEVAVHGLSSGTGQGIYGQVLGHAGLLVTEDVAVYAAAGYGLDLGPANDADLLVGGGVEVAVTEDLSLRAQYLHGFPIQGGNPKDQITVGATFQF